MNYANIYEAFISDRLSKEPEVFKGKTSPSRLYHSKHGNAPKGYEHHHIIPKSLGGTDDPENIISLALEDHWFAHCLLAKIHGGQMWTALWCMAKLSKEGTENRPKFINRHLWAIARAKSREVQSKRQTGQPNIAGRKEITLYHNDGRSITGHLTEVSEKTGVSLASLSRLLNKTQGITYSGWYAFDDEAEKARKSKKANGLKHAFTKPPNLKPIFCVETGEVFENRELAAASVGLKQGRNITSVCLGKRKTAGGRTWRYANQSSG